jgi:hypothetical protein
VLAAHTRWQTVGAVTSLQVSAECESQQWKWACAAAVKGPYAASYLSPYARIAPHMGALGFDRYIVNAVTPGMAVSNLCRCLLDLHAGLSASCYTVVCASRLTLQPQHDHDEQSHRTSAVSSVSHCICR